MLASDDMLILYACVTNHPSKPNALLDKVSSMTETQESTAVKNKGDHRRLACISISTTNSGGMFDGRTAALVWEERSIVERYWTPSVQSRVKIHVIESCCWRAAKAVI
jgi:hypothetical protein